MKVIVIKNSDGSCGFLYPSAALFDPASRDRRELRAKGIDFPDYKQIDLALKIKQIALSKKKTLEEKALAQLELKLKYTGDPHFVELINDVVYLANPTQESEQLILEWIARKDVPADEAWLITDPSSLPDRYFKAAWIADKQPNVIRIDITKAQEIQRNVLRVMRKPALDTLDVEYQKADETGDLDKKREIALKKRALRDVTKMQLPNDIKELKTFIPDILSS